MTTYFTQVGNIFNYYYNLVNWHCFVVGFFIGVWRYVETTCSICFKVAFRLVVSADSLTVESLLELLDEESLRKDTAIPSAEWSSDHLALLSEFRCKPRVRR